MGRGFPGSLWILIGGALWSLPVSVADFAYEEGGKWSNRDEWLVFELLLLTEQIKDVLGSFNLPKWLFWLLLSLLLSDSGIISPFWEKVVPAWYFSRKSQPNEWTGAEGLRRKGWVSLKGPKQKGMGVETRIVEVCLRLTCLNCLVLQGRAVEWQWGWAPVPPWTGKKVQRLILSLESGFPELIKGKDWDKLWFLGASSLGVRLVRGLKA